METTRSDGTSLRVFFMSSSWEPDGWQRSASYENTFGIHNKLFYNNML